jgi:hypothetical protein
VAAGWKKIGAGSVPGRTWCELPIIIGNWDIDGVIISKLMGSWGHIVVRHCATVPVPWYCIDDVL